MNNNTECFDYELDRKVALWKAQHSKAYARLNMLEKILERIQHGGPRAPGVFMLYPLAIGLGIVFVHSVFPEFTATKEQRTMSTILCVVVLGILFIPIYLLYLLGTERFIRFLIAKNILKPKR